MGDRVATYRFTYDKAGVLADLDRCKRIDRLAYGRIVIVLENLLGDPASCVRFVEDGWSDHEIEDVGLIVSLQQERINGLRVKFWDIHGWRLLFVADHRSFDVGLVAIMHRPDDYEKSSVLWERIRDAVERFGFGRY